VVSISIESGATAEDRRLIEEGLTRHALPTTLVPGFLPIAVLARDEQGVLVAGVVGTINWNWLHIQLVWVSESLRRTGLGTRLLHEIEQAAAQRGCTRAHLDTFSYQARPFYERLGYRVFGLLEDYPPGHQRFFMAKEFRDPSQVSTGVSDRAPHSLHEPS
jgi:GNAT superfamily N-acetyltransferase